MVKTLSGTTNFAVSDTLRVKKLNANGSLGTANQVLTTNGSVAYWADSTGATSVNVNAQYTWTNTQTFSNTITFSSVIVGTANNANNLAGVAAASYVQNTDNRTLSGNLVFSGANVTFSGNARLSGGLIANGALGTAGHVLHSNGTATYWAADDQGVTSVASGSGLTGGTITTTGTLSVIANSGIIANATGVYVNANNGLSTNSTGVFVVAGNTQLVSNSLGVFINQAQIDHNSLSNYSANRHTDHTAVSIATANGVAGGGDISATRNLYVVANSGLLSNSTGVFVIANNGLSTNSTGVFVVAGNSQLVSNATGVWINQAQIDHNSLANYSANQHVDHTSVQIATANGIAGGGTIAATRNLYVATGSGLTSNSTGVHVVANSGIIANATGTYVLANNGIVSNSTGVFVNANNGLSTNSTGVFVVPGNGLVTANSTGVHVGAGNGLTVNTTAVAVLPNNGIIANTTGIFVNANTGLTTNSTGLFVSNTYVNTSANFSVGGILTYTANVVTQAGLFANTVNATSYAISTTLVANTLGVYHTGTMNAASHTVGTSTVANATGLYTTGTVNAATVQVGTSVVANSSRFVVGTAVGLQANGSVGTSGHVLYSNGTTIYWATPLGSGYYKGNNGTVGSAGNANNIFRVNANTVSTNVSFSAGENAQATGPITIGSGVTVTISTGARVSIT